MALRTAAAVRAATRNNGVRSTPRRSIEQGGAQMEVHHRIGSGQGKLMISVAALLDLMPILLLMALVALFFAAGGAVGGAVGSATEKVYDSHLLTASALPGIGWAMAPTKWTLDFFGVGGKEVGAAVGTVAAGATMAAGGAATWWLWGLVYWFSAFMTSLLSIFIFPTWFAFLRYNMLSFLSAKKVTTNLVSFMCTGLFKMAPVLNLFPFPVYSLTVWRHIHIARAEDRELHAKLQASKRTGRRATEEGMFEA